MPTKKQATPANDYSIQESINGADLLGRDRMIIIRGFTPAEFFAHLAAMQTEIAEIVAPPTKFAARPAPRDDKRDAATQSAPVVPGLIMPTKTCPRGHLVYDNTADPSRKPNSPLVRCPECDFRVWQSPRTDPEKQNRVWWEEKYGVIK